jgi:3-dehydroquinate synthase
MKYQLENKKIEIVVASKLSNELTLEQNCVYVIDKKVYELFQQDFNSISDETRILLFEANEQSKNLASLPKIYAFFKAKNVHRRTLIYGIGGGVTTDITAFAASTYKRGCRCILIPTTLLGMVDAAIGGKTGINFENIKNGIGSFFPAEKVVLDEKYLETLSNSKLQAGMVEIIKMSFLSNTNLPELLERNATLIDLIREAIKTKMDICVHDLEDKNTRRMLNLGHTFGHVLESVSDYVISHGTAVSIGIRAAARLSRNLEFIPKSVCEQIENRMDDHNLPKSFPTKYLKGINKNGREVLKQDKKADTQVNLVLFKNLQKLFVYRTDESDEVLDVLREFAND